jgi:hypothetical protein
MKCHFFIHFASNPSLFEITYLLRRITLLFISNKRKIKSFYTHTITFTHTLSHLHTHTITFTHTLSHLHTHYHIYTHTITFTRTLITFTHIRMGVRRGGQKRALAPLPAPLVGQNSMFLTFFEEKWYLFRYSLGK